MEKVGFDDEWGDDGKDKDDYWGDDDDKDNDSNSDWD
jgi:hypothetical protein